MVAQGRAGKLDIAFLLNDPLPATEAADAPDALFGASSPVSARPGSPAPQTPDELALAPVKPVKAEPLPPRPPGPCSECGFRAPTQDALAAHARNAHPARPFACRVCGRCFGEKGNMNKHFR